MKTMVHTMGAIVAAIVLSLTVTAAPAAASPGDVWLPLSTASPQYDLGGGCLYKVSHGYFLGAPATAIWVYTPSLCGTMVALIEYQDGASAMRTAHSTAVATTGADGCGSFNLILAVGTEGPTPRTPRRALVWGAAGAHWYAADGLNAQPIHAHC